MNHARINHVHVVITKTWVTCWNDSLSHVQQYKIVDVFEFREDANKWIEDNGPWNEWRQAEVEMHEIK